MKIAALIPARTGSKGIPGKNFKDFCGKPLYQWTVDAAVASGIFDRIIVSSDGGLNGTGPRLPEVTYHNQRPKWLADDAASLDELLNYYLLQNDDIDIWCLLQPTSPLRTAEDIKRAYELFNQTDEKGEFRYESLVSVYSHPVFAWIKDAIGIPGDDETPQPLATYHYEKRSNRQDRKDWFLENGAIYFTRSYILKVFRCRLHGSILIFEMPYERSIEIDNPYDWFVAECTMKQKDFSACPWHRATRD
jgi:CMP-N,N'-diacetyllegionaminic acid synthase